MIPRNFDMLQIACYAPEPTYNYLSADVEIQIRSHD